MTWTTQDKLAAIERELSYRRKVFARRVENGSMTRDLAIRQIAIFEAIRDDYAKAEKDERLI